MMKQTVCNDRRIGIRAFGSPDTAKTTFVEVEECTIIYLQAIMTVHWFGGSADGGLHIAITFISAVELKMLYHYTAAIFDNDKGGQTFITGIYAGLGQGGFDEQMLASLSDEAVFTHPSRGINIINEGTLNPSNIGWVNVNYRWGKDGSNNDMYAKVRQTNLAIENLRTATFEDKVLNDRLKAKLAG